jgi:S-adenosylmethionine:tRNA ribosyltransferase-isomerase
VTQKSPIDSLKTAEFQYDLPQELIAQRPAPTRDGSRLLVANRATNDCSHQHFTDLPNHLRAGDVLVLNNSRVIPARLRGQKKGGQAAVEILLTQPASKGTWWAMLRPGKRLPPGTHIALHDRTGQPTALEAEVIEKNEQGHARLLFSGTDNITGQLDQLGELPLPPYIHREAHRQTDEDIERYQTIYADPAGSIAAPTAGLHFTNALLDQLRGKGIQIHWLTLHVGLGTFAPVKAKAVAEHQMHSENFSIPAETADAINAAKTEGRRVIAVGTTTVRVLESLAQNENPLAATEDSTNIFIYPPRDFRVVDGLITNFHLPQSTLLMLVSAFAAPGEMRGREWILKIYAEAVREKYRFFSFGDAMFIA